MSSQPKPSTDRKEKMSDQARAAVGAQVLRLKRPRRFSMIHDGRKGRIRQRRLLARRPIQSHLVMHRRRFTTGHKHKQPYQG